jgi:transposase-like protein
LKNRGVQDVFIACVDGLKGFPEAIEAVFPKTQVQLCIGDLLNGAWVSPKAKLMRCNNRSHPLHPGRA